MRVSDNLADEKVRRAVRELASSFGLVPKNEAAINFFQLQHPRTPEDLVHAAPTDFDYSGTTVATEDNIRRQYNHLQLVLWAG